MLSNRRRRSIGRSRRYSLFLSQRTYKSVPSPGNCINENRGLRRFAQSITEPSNRDIQAVVKVDECLSRPEFLSQFLPGDDLQGLFQESSEYLERLLLEGY